MNASEFHSIITITDCGDIAVSHNFLKNRNSEKSSTDFPCTFIEVINKRYWVCETFLLVNQDGGNTTDSFQ